MALNNYSEDLKKYLVQTHHMIAEISVTDNMIYETCQVRFKLKPPLDKVGFTIVVPVTIENMNQYFQQYVDHELMGRIKDALFNYYIDTYKYKIAQNYIVQGQKADKVILDEEYAGKAKGLFQWKSQVTAPMPGLVMPDMSEVEADKLIAQMTKAATKTSMFKHAQDQVVQMLKNGILNKQQIYSENHFKYMDSPYMNPAGVIAKYEKSSILDYGPAFKPSVSNLAPSLSQYIPDLHNAAKTFKCPGCCMQDTLWSLIQHLNDTEAWSREKIADWLETLDGVDLQFKIKEKDNA